MYHDWSQRSDDEVFKDASEQPNSQQSYYRDIEIRRRLYMLELENLKSQKLLLDATLATTKEQQLATLEMRRQSRLMFASVIAAFLAAFFTLLAAWIG